MKRAIKFIAFHGYTIATIGLISAALVHAIIFPPVSF